MSETVAIPKETLLKLAENNKIIQEKLERILKKI